MNSGFKYFLGLSSPISTVKFSVVTLKEPFVIQYELKIKKSGSGIKNSRIDMASELLIVRII